MKIPRSRRIANRSEFQNVRANGRSISGRFLVLGYLSDDSLQEPFRLGLITTRKLGNAVVRNRVRRRIRGIFHRLGDRLLPGHWIVIVARNAAAKATSEQLEKEWKWLMHRASLMQPAKDSE
ncbi:MAG: ribonuclease P protein component [Verrucomicrobiales bacterium]|nr:ribonuclease P protein component [Verrucomicrobiales bacterium]